MTPRRTDNEKDLLIDLTDLQERTEEPESIAHRIERDRLKAAAAYLVRN
jgi:hypothetical protein